MTNDQRTAVESHRRAWIRGLYPDRWPRFIRLAQSSWVWGAMAEYKPRLTLGLLCPWWN